MDWVTVILIFVLSLEQSSTTNDFPCKAREIVKELVPVKFQAYPRTATVLRCSGFSGKAMDRHEKCVAIEKKKWPISFQREWKPISKELVNHTKCAMRCVCAHDNYDCRNMPKEEDIPCPDESIWSFDECKCVPTENACRVINNPGSSGSISVYTLVASLIGEFLILLVLLFFIKYYKSKGCSYRPRLPSTSNKDNSDEEEKRLCYTEMKRDTHESISGTILDNYDMNQNGYHR